MTVALAHDYDTLLTQWGAVADDGTTSARISPPLCSSMLVACSGSTGRVVRLCPGEVVQVIAAERGGVDG